MPAVAKMIVALMLFLGAALCIYGFIAEKLIQISVPTALVVSALCAATFIFFAFFDPER